MLTRAQVLPARYRDPRLVGRGGMAEIFRATDAELGREVAVKVLDGAGAEDDGVRARFLREARAAARLSVDSHTVSVYDVGEFDGRPFLVMEYLGGGSLDNRLRAGTIAPQQALTWLEQAGQALDNAHDHGVVHRDVKPANLLLDAAGNLYVADFGIARAEGLESHTQTGVVLGTAGYLAPEQIRGQRATAASDRYALAVVAYELLTGSRPGAARPATLPLAAVEVFGRALAPDPESRFESCLAFVSALREALRDSPTQPTVVLSRRPMRAPAAAAAIVVLGALGAIGAAFATRGDDSPAPARRIVTTVTVPAPTHAASVSTSSPVVRAPAGDGPNGHGHGPGGGKGHGKKKEKD
jgi:serine/threonine protein kinase